MCSSCCDRLERELSEVPALVSELDVALSKQARIGSGAGKSGKGWAREKLPINAGAMKAHDHLSSILTSWARDVSGDVWRPAVGAEQSSAATRLLLSSIPDIRVHPAVDELVDEIEDAVRKARYAIDRPRDRMYLGVCSSATLDLYGREASCEEELWAQKEVSEIRCKVCTTEWQIAERRAWLLLQAADMLFTVKDASKLVGEVGQIRVTEASIRGYIHRKRIAYRPGGTMIRLGDLLDVVQDEGERRSA